MYVTVYIQKLAELLCLFQTEAIASRAALIGGQSLSWKTF